MKGNVSESVGLQVQSTVDSIKEALDSCIAQGYGFLLVDISSRNKVSEQLALSCSEVTEPFLYSELALTSDEWRRGIVGVLTNLNEDLNRTIVSRDPPEERAAELKNIAEILSQQLQYCLHLCVTAAVVELSEGKEGFQLANIISGFMQNSETKLTMNVWIKIPMAGGDPISEEEEEQIEWEGRKRPFKETPWKVWNRFRGICGHHQNICPVLELGEDVPPPEEVARWLAEPVKAVFISSNVFMTNNDGFPVLSKQHQEILKKFSKIGVQVIIDAERFEPSLNLYPSYTRFLSKTAREEAPKNSTCGGIDSWVSGYEDELQIPLQPLRDHLPGSTYEVFEKDPVKYVLYENAVYQALLDRYPEPTNAKIVVMVVGAGRGPLVTRSLAAADRAKRNIHVYAVEKNVFAANTLQHQKNELWKDRVTVVHGDMRDFNPPDQADILVSELLGSFSDNELSPECLDGAQKLLKADGIMIPKRYSSFVSPVMSIKYYQDITGMAKPQKIFENLHVVHMNNKYIIAEPQEVFTFEHPNFVEPHTNDRAANLKFVASQDCVLNGFAGYFDSVLYGDITMSILPSSHTPGMFSWFAMFIPLRELIDVKKGDEIDAHFWRKSSRDSVWYEWTVTHPKTVGLHNAGGRSSLISLN